MTISKTKDAVCEEIQRIGNVKVSVAERELLAKAPVAVLHWVRLFTEEVFERGFERGYAQGKKSSGPLPQTPEEMAERVVGPSHAPFGSLAAARKCVADAIRLDRTGRW